MVSTRGVKLKFYEGERVLCYEPDPTKAKVLYDSKVLEVVTNKDHRGRKSIEYLIHFQGWNSSWDRCVGEEFVLKDTPENRQLQKDLAEKSQLQFGTYLYRRERKKHNRKTGDRVTSEEDGNCSSPARMDTDDGQDQDVSTSSDDDSSVDEDIVPIELPQELREILDQDFILINTKQKLVKLPAEPNVVTILENYWKYYATNQLCGLSDRNNGRYRLSMSQSKPRPEDIRKNVSLSKEIIDGIRIYFDFTVNDLLLYKSEQGQIQTMPPQTSTKVELQGSEDDYHHPNNNTDEDYNHNEHHDHGDRKHRYTKRRNLRSNTNSESQANGTGDTENCTNNVKPCTSVDNSNTDTNNTPLKLINWRLLPEHVYYQQPPPPSLVYGAIHLTRLLVKMPELLAASAIPDDRMKVLLRHIDMFVYFLNEHKEWYGEKCYIDM